MFKDAAQEVWSEIFLGRKVLSHIPVTNRLKINYTHYAIQSFTKNNIFTPRIAVNHLRCEAFLDWVVQIALPPRSNFLVFSFRQISIEGRHHLCPQTLKLI